MSPPIADAARGRSGAAPPRDAARRGESPTPGSSAARFATPLLGRDVVDVDLAFAGDVAAAARAIAAGRRPPRSSSPREFETWRASPATAAGTSTSPACAATRSRSISRCATSPSTRSRVPLATAATPIDPTGGLADLEAGVLRAVSERSLRRRSAAGPARRRASPPSSASSPTRRRSELARGAAAARRRARRRAPVRRARRLLAGPDPLRGLALLDELGATAACSPSSRRCAASARTRTTTSTSTATRSRCCAACSRSSATCRASPATRPADRCRAARRAARRRADPRRRAALRRRSFHDIGKPGDPQERGRLRHLHRPRSRRGARSSPGSARG